MFDYRQTIVTGPQTWTKALIGNRNRVSLIVSSAPTVTDGLIFATKADSALAFHYGMTPLEKTFAYHDYGPLIQDEIWVLCTNAGTAVSFVEVIRIPNT